MAVALLTRRSLRFFLSKTLWSSSSLLPVENQLLPFSHIHGQHGNPILHSFTFSTNNSRTPPPPSGAGGGYSAVNDPSPNWSNRPPRETILLDGCDYKHWLIVMEFPDDPKPSEDKMITSYVNTLATVLGSEEEAKKKIYSVCTTTYTGFGALISEELSYKVKGLPGVLWVLPDSYLDVRNKDYGGDLLVDGKVVHRPQYRFDQTYNRNRSRAKHDTRREAMQVQSRGQMSKAGQSLFGSRDISPTTEDRKDAFQEPQKNPTSPVRGTGTRK